MPYIGLTASAFDLLHAGHVLMLKEAKTVCDYLICCLQVDPSYDRIQKNKPVQTLVERYAQLQAVKYVDEIIPYQTESDLMDILMAYPIDIRIIGEEYREADFTGKSFCEQNGIKIHYNSRKHRFSTSGLRERVMNEQSVGKNLSRGTLESSETSTPPRIRVPEQDLAGDELSSDFLGDPTCGPGC